MGEIVAGRQTNITSCKWYKIVKLRHSAVADCWICLFCCCTPEGEGIWCACVLLQMFTFIFLIFHCNRGAELNYLPVIFESSGLSSTLRFLNDIFWDITFKLLHFTMWFQVLFKLRFSCLCSATFFYLLLPFQKYTHHNCRRGECVSEQCMHLAIDLQLGWLHGLSWMNNNHALKMLGYWGKLHVFKKKITWERCECKLWPLHPLVSSTA